MDVYAWSLVLVAKLQKINDISKYFYNYFFEKKKKITTDIYDMSVVQMSSYSVTASKPGQVVRARVLWPTMRASG